MWLQGKDQHTGSVWGMLCFVSGFGVYFSKRLDHGSRGSRGSRRLMRKKALIAAVSGCRSLFGRGNGVACLEEASGLCGKRILPPLWIAAVLGMLVLISLAA